MPRAIPRTKEEELAARPWRIHTNDERTLLVLETMLRDTLKGPIKKVPLIHIFYREKERLVYNVPFSIAWFFITNRDECGYRFEAFSKSYSTKPFALFKENGNLPREVLQKTFGINHN